MNSTSASNRDATVWQSLRRRRWLWWVLAAAVLFALLLLLLPYGIQLGTQKWLGEHGADEARIEDVDFNPFTGELAVTELRIKVGDHYTLTLPRAFVDVDWLPLSRRRAEIRALRVANSEILIEQKSDGALQFGGISIERRPPPAKDADEKQWGVAVDELLIENTTVKFQSDRLALALDIDALRFTQLSSWQPERPAVVDLNGKLNGAPLQVSAELMPFAAQPQGNATIRLQGLGLAAFAALAQPAVETLEGELSADISVDGRIHDGAVTGRHQGNIEVREVTAALPDAQARAGTVNWRGSASLRTGTALPAIEAQGRLAADDVAITLSAAAMSARGSALEWNGKIQNAPGDTADITMTAAAQARGIAVSDARRQLQLLSLADLNVPAIEFRSPIRVNATGLVAEDLALLRPQAGKTSDPKQRPMLALQRATLDSMAYASAGNVALGTLQLEGLAADLERRADGRLAVIAQLQSPADVAPPEVATESSPLGLSIAHLVIKPDSQVSFVDASVDPQFATTLDIDSLTLTELDSASPNRAAKLSVAGKLGEFATLKIDGTVMPFADPIALAMTGRIEQLTLPPLSSYTAPMLGYNLSSGQLNSDLKLDIGQGKLDGEAKLRLNNLTVKAVDAEKMAQMTTQLDMPLDAALSMLRDKNNNIGLTIPVTGELSDPKFDISDAINQAIGKAMRVAALSYLKYSLQPFGTILTVAQLAGKAAAAVQLEPVSFAPGTAQADTASDDYLSRIAKLMTERPKMQLRLCGKATAGDRQTLLERARAAAQPPAVPGGPSAPSDGTSPVSPRPPEISEAQLLDLANERATSLKLRLVQQHRVDPQRLFVCQPEVDAGPDARPRVDLLI